MYKIEAKNIENKPYLYAIRRVKVGEKSRKLSIYIGKTAPKTKQQKQAILDRLCARESALVPEIVAGLQLPDKYITHTEYAQVEKARILYQYEYARLTEKAREHWWRTFTIRFIFESNKMEGSRLSESEVSVIALGKRVKKESSRTEIREVENALEAMQLIRNQTFVLNERTILKLHALITRDLGIVQGFKQKGIVVNNKPTTAPGQVRKELAKLIKWWKEEKNISPFYKAVIFHQRFEHIHPFEDGNGRTGRFLLLWMLIKAGYDMILFKNINRQSYFSALSKADEGQSRVWIRYAMKTYNKTIYELLEK